MTTETEIRQNVALMRELLEKMVKLDIYKSEGEQYGKRHEEAATAVANVAVKMVADVLVDLHKVASALEILATLSKEAWDEKRSEKSNEKSKKT